MRAIVDRVMAAVPSGSYLTLWDGTDTGDAVPITQWRPDGTAEPIDAYGATARKP
jgi:hypothetical protein